MTWDEHNAPVPGYGAGPGGPVQPPADPAGYGRVVHPTGSPGGQPVAGVFPGLQPPVGPMMAPGAHMPPTAAPPMPPMPQSGLARSMPPTGYAPQPGPSVGMGVAPPQPSFRPLPAAMKAAQDSDKPDSHDDVWIERTKRAIAETQNDPYRQVQLIQHLNKLYLKERFGREVQADKG